jgi:predicted TIM-barrel fold metal-dependent hydrolase
MKPDLTRLFLIFVISLSLLHSNDAFRISNPFLSNRLVPFSRLASQVDVRGGTGPSTTQADENERILAEELHHCQGEIIDPHLHTAPWFKTSEELVQELEKSNVSIGILYDPYPKVFLPYDVNTYVHSIASSSNGKIFMLASMNMTHDNWEDHREEEMERLKSFLEKKETLGGKLAPPHTCLPLDSPMANDFIDVIAQSEKKLVAIHIGTTPFCGPLGEMYGVKCNCTERFVDPLYLIPKIEQYPNVKFILLHSGHEFLPEDSPHHYGFKHSDTCIDMAKKYPNVYLSISALFAQQPDGTLKYPGGDRIVRKMKDADVCHKVFWGSDASFFQGQIRPVLITAIKAVRDGGWTQEERTWALRGLTRELFNIPSSSS